MEASHGNHLGGSKGWRAFLLTGAIGFFLSPIVLCADPIKDAEEQHRLLEILKSAPPPPTTIPPQESIKKSGPTDRQAIAVYKPSTRKETIRREAEANETFASGDELPPDPPYLAGNPMTEDREGMGGETTSGQQVLGPSPTPPSPLYNTTVYPYCTIFKLLMRFEVNGNDYWYVCSAASTGPFHLLTAGHCVFNWDPDGNGDTSDARWASAVYAWAAQTDQVDPQWDPEHPYGEAHAVLLRSYTGWTQNSDHNHDWAVITLDRRDGDHTGWMGRETATTSALNFSGYPVETPFVPAGTMVQYKGYDDGNVLWYTGGRIALAAYLYGGHSGGPSWRFDGESRYIQGIHSTSNRGGYAEDTLLTSGKREHLNSFMAEDEKNFPPTPRPDLMEYQFDGNSKGLFQTTARQGEWFGATYNAFNSGFADTGPSVIDFFLCRNPWLSGQDRWIWRSGFSGLSPYTYSVWTDSFQVPPDQPPGTYYVGWTLSCTEPEYCTTNNWAVMGQTLTVLASPGYLELSPACDLISTGIEGGPFSPSSHAYEVSNRGGSPVDFIVDGLTGWVDASITAGHLPPGASAMLVLEIGGDARFLAPGSYWTTVRLLDVTPGSAGYSPDISVSLGIEPASSDRGDINGDGRLDITDAIGVLEFLFIGGTYPACPECGDFDDDGKVNIADAIAILVSLFGNGAA